MNTKNIFRMLLMAVMLLTGASSVKAEDIWTGTSNSDIKIEKENFANITSNDKIVIEVTDLNIYYWQLGISVNGNTNSTASLINNWKGESYGYQTSSNNNLKDGNYLEFMLNNDGVDAIKANGLELKPTNVTITKISIVNGEGGGGQEPTPTVKKYKLTFYDNNALYSSEEVEPGTPIAAPVRDGYIYTFWGDHPDIMPESDVSVYGIFNPTYTLTLVFDEAQGTATATKTAEIVQNDQINVTVNPAEGYEVAAVTFADANGGTPNNWGSNPYTVQFGQSNITCTVTFRQAAAVAYNIWNGTVQGGSVTASPTTAEAGATVTLTLAPNGEYVLESLVVRDEANNHIEVSQDNTFTMPASNVWIDATFVDPASLLPKHTLTYTVGEETKTAEVAEGTDLESILPALDRTGYTGTWQGLPEDGKMPTEDLEVTAVYSINSYTLTYKINGEVYGTPQHVEYGKAIEPAIMPGVPEGYHFSGWQNEPETMPAEDVEVNGYYIFNASKLTIGVGATGINTFCTPNALRFEGNEAVKAYIATSKNSSEVRLTQVIGTVAPGTGLILRGSGNATAEVEVVESGDNYSNNLLVGVLSTPATINSASKYVLVLKDGMPKFADTAGTSATVPTGKAYLDAPGSMSRQLIVSFDDDVTAITAVSSQATSEAVVYDLQGRRVANPQKGLFIVNGKKVNFK